MNWYEHDVLRRFDSRVLLIVPKWDDDEMLHDLTLETASDEALLWLGMEATERGSLVDSAGHIFTPNVLKHWTALLRNPLPRNVTHLTWQSEGVVRDVELELSLEQGHVIAHLLTRTYGNTYTKNAREELLRDTFTQSLAINVIELLPAPVFLKDNEHRWIGGNKAFCDIMGKPIDQLVGRSDFDFFSDEEAKVFWEMDDIVISQKRELINEESLTDGDGVKRWILTHKIPIDLEDGRTGLLGYFTDITQRKLAERQLIHSMEVRDKLTELSETKSLFLARMSHELRTPLNAITGYSELAEEEALDMGYDALIPDLRNIQKAAHHLLSLINDVLDLSKIEQGKLVPVIEEFDVPTLMESCTEMISTLLAKDATIRLVCSDSIPQACTDKRRLKQAILNLLSNAAKFSLVGEIVLSADVVDEDLLITVSDSGPGIEETMRAKLFVPFESIGRDGKRLREGTGIGLSLTRHLCNLLGGDVDIHSENGNGATCIIRVPLVLDYDPTHDSPQVLRTKSHDELVQQFDHAGAPSKSTVLLIDDDATMYDLARRFCPNDSIQILWASSPSEGLELALEAQPSLILLDIFMPDPVGWEVLAKLKKDPRTCEIPVVVLSFAQEPSRAKKAGAQGAIAKPLSRTQWSKLLDL